MGSTINNVFDYLFTFKIDNDSIVLVNAEPIPSIQGTPYDILYPNDLVIGNTLFDGTQVYGCKLLQNQYICCAINDIEINGDVSVVNGYSVTFKAGNSIVVEPEAEIDPEVLLIVEPIYDFSQPMPMQSDLAVKTFCEDTTQYKALLTERSVQLFYDSLAQANPAPQPEPSPIEFIVFPNPTTGASQAGLNLPELATVSISIVDITGKVQGRPVQKQVLPMGRNVLNLESEPLAPGVYFVQVVVNGEKLMQRLVKQ